MSMDIVDVLTISNENQPGLVSRMNSILLNRDIKVLGFTGHDGEEAEAVSLLVKDVERGKNIFQQEGLEVDVKPAVLSHASDQPDIAEIIMAHLKVHYVEFYRSFSFIDEDGTTGGLVVQTSHPRRTKRLLEEMPLEETG